MTSSNPVSNGNLPRVNTGWLRLVFFQKSYGSHFFGQKIFKKSKKIRKNSEFFFLKIPKMYVFFPYKYLTILSTFNTKSSYNFFSIQYFLLSTHIIHFPHQISIQTHLLPIFFTLYSYFPLSTPIPYKLFSFQYFLLSTHIFVLLSICRK